MESNTTSLDTSSAATTPTSSTVEPNTNTPNVSTVEPEVIAYKDLYDEAQTKIANLTKEVADLKVANAKLAIQQSAATTQPSVEEILNKMF